MDNSKKQVLDSVKQANNILVTVSSNPSIDQLAACLGLTIMLNELGKHATAVFSGEVPSIIEFLQPEKTLEKTTDSLRDFIIALDKSKADKLRYKVEDKVVKIFITPYHTRVSEKDLEFSQGDFNVEVVIALGVHEQGDLDKAITANGRILHDATVISINTAVGEHIGTVNWQDQKASSLSEMIASLSDNLDRKVLDNQVATALLTGIVSETNRFSNNKTTPETMKTSAMLMSAGANQQLVATKLQEPEPVKVSEPKPPAKVEPPVVSPQEDKKPTDGTLEVNHEDKPPIPAPKPSSNSEEESEDDMPQINIDNQGHLRQLDKDDKRPSLSDYNYNSDEDEDKPSGIPSPDVSSGFIFNPASPNEDSNVNSDKGESNSPLDSLSLPEVKSPMLTHDGPTTNLNNRHLVIEPPTETDTPEDTSVTSNMQPKDINTEKHEVNMAREAVNSAIDSLPSTAPLPPIAALNAQPLVDSLHTNDGGNDHYGTAPPMPGNTRTFIPPGNPDFNERPPAADSPSARPLEFPSIMTQPPTTSPPVPPLPENDNMPPPPPVPPPMMPLL